MNLKRSEDQTTQKSIVDSIPIVRKFLSKKVKASQEVDDLVQETIARTIKSVGDRPIGNPAAYAITAAKSVLFDYWKKSNQDQNVELNEEIESAKHCLESNQINLQKLEIIKKLVNDMPALRREVFIRRRLEGQTREEIATEMNLSVDSVKKHINRALADLAEGVRDHDF